MAREALDIESEFASRDALFKRANAHRYRISNGTLSPSITTLDMEGADAILPPFAFWSLIAGELLAATAVALCYWWMFLNIWLLRGVGAPSSFPARWGLAFSIVVPVSLFLFWVTTQAEPYTGKLAPLFKDGPPIYVLFFVAIVSLLALWCVVGTVARHKTALLDPKGDQWHTHFPTREIRPWLAPLWLGASIFLVLVSAFAMLAVLLSTGTASLPINTPLGRQDVFDIARLVRNYGVVMAALGGAAWLIRWRWRSPATHPLTHSGLRWSKETIGASICVLMWLYLLVALAAWPAREHAKQLIAERWQKGDWIFLQEHERKS